MNPPETNFPVETGHPQKWTILAIMCTCLILVVAGVSSLNIAIPSIIEDLNPTSTETLWIIDAYALVFAGLLLPAGALGDRYGRKGALLLGLGLFAAGAIWSSCAGDPTMLIIARGSMGVGAAFVMPATLSILVAVFPVRERAKAIAVWSGFAGAGGAIGIIGGGALLETFWWGSVFFINVPMAALAAVLIAVVVPTSRDAKQRPLDPIGSLLSIGGLGSLVYAIIEGGEVGWSEGSTIGWFVAAAILLVGWVRYELSAEHPMLDPRLFKHLPFGLGAFTVTISFVVMFGFFFIITQYFQFVQGQSPLNAGVRMLPFTVAMIAVAPRSPALAAALGKRGAMVAGLSVQVVGFVILANAGVDTDYAIVVVAMVLLAASMATLMQAGSEAIVSSLPPSKAGVGSAVNDTTREVGGALGIAVLGSLLANGYRSSVNDSTGSLPPELADLAEDGIGGAFRVAEQTQNFDLIDPARQAFVDGMSLAFWVAAAIGVISAGVIFSRYPRKGHEPAPMEDEAVQSLIMTATDPTIDPRIARTREVVVSATAELLAECGFDQITIEAIADRSGVARSTIYRNWPNRAELFVEGFGRLCAFEEIGDLGSLDAELRALGQELTAGLTNDQWGHALPSLIGSASHDPDLVAAQRAFSELRRAQSSVVFARAIERGEIGADAAPSELAEQFAAGFFFRRLMTMRPLDDAFIESQIQAIRRIAGPR